MAKVVPSFRSGMDGNGSDDDTNEPGPWGRLNIPEKIKLFVDNQIGTGLHAMHKQGQLCDVQLVVGGENFVVHKVVLANCSPFFLNMFTTNTPKPKTNDAGLPSFVVGDCDSETFTNLLEFAYTGALEVPPPHLMRYLVASHNLQFFGLREVLMAQLLGKGLLNQETCSEIWDIGQTLGFAELESMAEDYLRRHFGLVCKCDSWLELSEQQLIHLLSDDFLNVENDGETQVFEAVARWISHSIDTRKASAQKLLSCVRLPPQVKATGNQLLTCTSKHEALALVEEVRKQMQEIAATANETIKQTRTSGTEICAIGGIGGTFEFSISVPYASIFNPRDGKWKDDPKVAVPACRYGEGISRLESCVYKVGGFTASGVFGQVEVFDMLSNIWGPAPPMPNPRAYCAVACCGSYIYALGGIDSHFQVVGDVERFDPVNNLWEQLDALDVPVMASSAIELNGQLYLVGGSDDVQGSRASRRNVYKYDSDSDLWEEVSSMRNARCKFALACLNGLMYAIGGWDRDGNPLSSVEIYDPVQDEWTNGPDLHTARANFSAVTLDSTIFVLGGTGTDGFAMASVERFDPRNGHWVLAQNMPTARQSFLATTWDVNYIFQLPVTVNPNPDDCKNVMDMSQKLRLQHKLSNVELLVTPRGGARRISLPRI